MPELRKCAMCKEPVLWINDVPVDPEPSCDGNIAIIDGSHYLKPIGELRGQIYDGQYHTQHAATCRVLHPPKGKK